MKTANVHQAKTSLSKLLNAAAAGDEVVITRRGRPGAVTRFKLQPLEDRPKPVLFGALRDKIVFATDYDQADQEILEMFEQSLNKPDKPV